jgi:hypothetical protein
LTEDRSGTEEAEPHLDVRRDYDAQAAEWRVELPEENGE